MTSISPQDIATQLPVILSRVAQGEEFVITDQGQALARIVPPDPAASHPLSNASWQSQFDSWMQEVDSRAARYPNGFNVDDSRESIYNGRGA
jgi:antitoxin (DNA-binding transcriptional repressor) of toxin-antitoxin stability system